jgi:hypothetical protein
MIPKIIHYCWFGGNELPEEYALYIQEWRDLHPDWEIIRWDESNSPMEFQYMQNAQKNKQWANMSNLVRLVALKSMGGIYLDSDVKVLKPLTPLLSNNCFFGFEEGNENSDIFWVNNAIAGSTKEHSFINVLYDKFLAEFDGTEVPNESSPRFTTKVLKEVKGLHKYGFQHLDDIVLYPNETFYPIGYNEAYKLKSINPDDYPDSYAIHMWGRTWFTHDLMLKMIDEKQEIINHQKHTIASTLAQLSELETKCVSKNQTSISTESESQNKLTTGILGQLQNYIIDKFNQTNTKLEGSDELLKLIEEKDQLIFKDTQEIMNQVRVLIDTLKSHTEVVNNLFAETDKKIISHSERLDETVRVQAETNHIFTAETALKNNRIADLEKEDNVKIHQIKTLENTVFTYEKSIERLTLEKEIVERELKNTMEKNNLTQELFDKLEQINADIRMLFEKNQMISAELMEKEKLISFYKLNFEKRSLIGIAKDRIVKKNKNK